MADVAFVLGNGESRKGIEINDLMEKGKVYACNGVYRTHRPDYLVAVDPKMLLEIAEGDYILHNKVKVFHGILLILGFYFKGSVLI